MKLRKPGTFRSGDIVLSKGGTRMRKVHSVYWTEKGDVIRLYTSTSSLGPFPAERFELVVPREQRICEVCDLYIYGPVHPDTGCPVR